MAMAMGSGPTVFLEGGPSEGLDGWNSGRCKWGQMGTGGSTSGELHLLYRTSRCKPAWLGPFPIELVCLFCVYSEKIKERELGIEEEELKATYIERFNV